MPRTPSTLVIPLTTQLIDDAEPLRLRVQAQASCGKTPILLMDQLRAIDNPPIIEDRLTRVTAAKLRTWPTPSRKC